MRAGAGHVTTQVRARVGHAAASGARDTARAGLRTCETPRGKGRGKRKKSYWLTSGSYFNKENEFPHPVVVAPSFNIVSESSV